MTNSIESLIQTGTKLYLDSVEPSEVDQNLAWGAVGATSNPATLTVTVPGNTPPVASFTADPMAGTAPLAEPLLVAPVLPEAEPFHR